MKFSVILYIAHNNQFIATSLHFELTSSFSGFWIKSAAIKDEEKSFLQVNSDKVKNFIKNPQIYVFLI